MKTNAVSVGDLGSIVFEEGCVTITVGDHVNRFSCCKEDEETLTHMMDVIAHGGGLYGTDMADFACVFERCSDHCFLTYPNRKLNAADSPVAWSESKAAILFVTGGPDMGLSDVNRIVEETVKCYPAETEILFTAENSGSMPEGYYTLCVLE